MKTELQLPATEPGQACSFRKHACCLIYSALADTTHSLVRRWAADPSAATTSAYRSPSQWGWGRTTHTKTSYFCSRSTPTRSNRRSMRAVRQSCQQSLQRGDVVSACPFFARWSNSLSHGSLSELLHLQLIGLLTTSRLFFRTYRPGRLYSL